MDTANTAPGSEYSRRLSKARAKYIADKVKKPIATIVSVGAAHAPAQESAAGSAAGKASPAPTDAKSGGSKVKRQSLQTP